MTQEIVLSYDYLSFLFKVNEISKIISKVSDNLADCLILYV